MTELAVEFLIYLLTAYIDNNVEQYMPFFMGLLRNREIGLTGSIYTKRPYLILGKSKF